MPFLSLDIMKLPYQVLGEIKWKESILEGIGYAIPGACEVECPKGISLENIARMNREYLSASFKG